MYLCSRGTIAQLVEQRTENPCVPGSNPGSTTKKGQMNWSFFLHQIFPLGNSTWRID